jgi:N-acetylmuramoyl-L-alanine amidase
MSSNNTPNRLGHKPEALVIHIADGTFTGTKNWAHNPDSFISYHYLISKEGSQHLIVDPEHSAWHAGFVHKPKWNLLKKGINPNHYTIGICLAAYVHEKPTMMQMFSLLGLIQTLCEEYNIPIDKDHIIPHNWIHSGKECPGPYINTELIAKIATWNLLV